MGFSVDAAALTGLPRLLERLGDDAVAGRNYLERNGRLKGGEGIFNVALGGHEEAVRKVGAFLEVVQTASRTQADRVASAIDAYNRTDLNAAARLDSELAGTAGAPVLDTSETANGGFADRDEAQQHLTAPGDYAAGHDVEMKLYQYLSPSSYVRQIIWEATSLGARLGICDRPIDVVEEFMHPWLGDWAGIRAMADVYVNLGFATTAMSRNVVSGTVDAQFTWSGNASDAARRDLSRTSTAIAQADPRLTELADEYKKVAETVRELTELAAGILLTACDLAATAILELTLAVATSETVIGGVVFGAAGARALAKLFFELYELADLVKLGLKASEAFGTAVTHTMIIDPHGPMPELAIGGAARPPSVSGKLAV